MNYPQAIAELLVKHGADINAQTVDLLTPLHMAVEEERYEVAKFLLVNGADINAPRADTLTPIHIAASAGHEYLAELLLKAGASANAPSANAVTPLHLAVSDLPLKRHNNVAPRRSRLVMLLLSYDANVNARTAESNTPLHIAIKCNHVELIPILLKYGADVDAEDCHGRTPLSLAIESGCPTALSYILKSRPDVQNKSNQNALSIAVRRKAGNEEIIRRLLHYGIPVKPEDATNRSIVSCVIRNGFTKTATEIFRHGTTTALDFGLTPLHVATIYRRKSIVKVLLRHGADVNAKDFAGKTPIYFATSNADYGLFKLFLRKKAVVRNNLLHLAARSGSLKILRTLLKLCAVNARDEKGRTALHHVNFSVEPVQLTSVSSYSLKTLRLSPTDVLHAHVARLLLMNGADVNARDILGEPPLHMAVREGSESIVGVLLEYQAELDLLDGCGHTALHKSVHSGSLVLTRRLLKAGASVNTQPGEPTPLHVATKAGHTQHVQLLLEYGANVDAVCEEGTALQIASATSDLPVIKLLLEYCADVNARSDLGTPLHTAASNGHKDLVSHLLLSGSDINIKNEDSLTPVECVAKLSCNSDLAPGALVYLMSTFRILLEWVVRMKCLGLFVTEENLEFLTVESSFMTRFETFFDWSLRLSELVSKCEAEVGPMRAQTIGESNVTYYDFATKSSAQVNRLLANASIVQTLSLGLYHDQFRTYASMIRSRFEVGLRRRNLEEDSRRVFFRRYLEDLPEICIDRIIDNLTDGGLKMLINVCSKK